MRSRRDEVEPSTTKDGAQIRELMHPAAHGNRAQSLAEARVLPGRSTTLHYHKASEEVYHVLEGRGVLTRGDEEIPLRPGDTVCMPPGTPHRLTNDGAAPLVVLCACAPPYAHDDTVLLE